jgi:hypothetical protein
MKLDPDAQSDNKLIFEQITTHLAQLEEDAGNLPRAIDWLHAAQKVSRLPRTCCKNALTTSRKKWPRSSPSRRPSFIDRAIPLGLSAAALL